MISAAKREFSCDWRTAIQAERDRLRIVPTDGFVGTQEAGELLGMTARQVIKLVKAEAIPAQRVHHYGAVFSYRIPASAIFKLKVTGCR